MGRMVRSYRVYLFFCAEVYQKKKYILEKMFGIDNNRKLMSVAMHVNVCLNVVYVFLMT